MALLLIGIGIECFVESSAPASEEGGIAVLISWLVVPETPAKLFATEKGTHVSTPETFVTKERAKGAYPFGTPWDVRLGTTGNPSGAGGLGASGVAIWEIFDLVSWEGKERVAAMGITRKLHAVVLVVRIHRVRCDVVIPLGGEACLLSPLGASKQTDVRLNFVQGA